MGHVSQRDYQSGAARQELKAHIGGVISVLTHTQIVNGAKIEI